MEFNRHCQELAFQELERFSDEELATCLKIQECINEIYRDDVRRSKEQFGAE